MKIKCKYRWFVRPPFPPSWNSQTARKTTGFICFIAKVIFYVVIDLTSTVPPTTRLGHGIQVSAPLSWIVETCFVTFWFGAVKWRDWLKWKLGCHQLRVVVYYGCILHVASESYCIYSKVMPLLTGSFRILVLNSWKFGGVWSFGGCFFAYPTQ